MFLAFVLIYSPVGKVTALSTVWHTLYLCYRTLFSTEGELIYFLAVGYSMPLSFISPCLSLFSSFGEVKNTVSGLVRFISLIINVLMCFYGAGKAKRWALDPVVPKIMLICLIISILCKTKQPVPEFVISETGCVGIF